jgi:chloride channel protein, CIC family
MSASVPQQRPASPPTDPLAVLRSRQYLTLLVLAAVLGVPISAAAYFFLQLVSHLQQWVFTDLPKGVGFDAEPVWWPLLPLGLAGLLVGLTIRYLPGRGGKSPVEGLHAGGAPAPSELLGIFLAALATLALGAVLGPEAPLIALGAGLAAWTIRLARRDAPAQTVAIVGATGSFAAVSTLLGSPLLGAFLLMEAAGLGGATASLVLVPGLLASGIGALIFVGLDSVTGLGEASLTIPDLPPFTRPDVAEFGWALLIGVTAAVLGSAIHRLGVWLKTLIEPRLVAGTVAAGLAVAVLAILYDASTDKSSSDVLFSGQSALGPLISNSATYSVGTLLMLIACKSVAYGASMSSFRGGPIFPAMFIGAAGGIALSHLPGLPMVAGVAMGIGAMCVVMLRLPVTSVLLATLLLLSDGLALMPLVIVAVVVAYVVSAWFVPAAPASTSEPAPAETTARTPVTGS